MWVGQNKSRGHKCDVGRRGLLWIQCARWLALTLADDKDWDPLTNPFMKSFLRVVSRILHGNPLDMLTSLQENLIQAFPYCASKVSVGIVIVLRSGYNGLEITDRMDAEPPKTAKKTTKQYIIDTLGRS
jgi:hypothetical protein